ncbi:MAG: heme synthase [Aeromicrobium sp.]|nr:heme synthase [Aeromicrobium sp.]
MGVNSLGLRSPDQVAVERWAWAAVIANSVIVLTGGLVRLTGSGLGCPTWPRCSDNSFVPHRALGAHGVIEFSNRMLTYVLVAVVVAAYLAVRGWADSTRETRRLALIIMLGVPLQAVVGGISVLTDLNPWIVSLHLIISMMMIATSMLLVFRVRGVAPGGVLRAQTGRVISMYVVLWAVVYLGTVVTGSGPHAGDASAPRNGLNPHVMSHVHAGAVYVLVALTLVLCWELRKLPALRLGLLLLAMEFAQATIGFVQYFTNLPIALVAAHLVGAAVLIATGTRVLLEIVSPASESVLRPREPARRR